MTPEEEAEMQRAMKDKQVTSLLFLSFTGNFLSFALWHLVAQLSTMFRVASARHLSRLRQVFD